MGGGRGRHCGGLNRMTSRGLLEQAVLFIKPVLEHYAEIARAGEVARRQAMRLPRLSRKAGVLVRAHAPVRAPAASSRWMTSPTNQPGVVESMTSRAVGEDSGGPSAHSSYPTSVSGVICAERTPNFTCPKRSVG